MEPVDAAVLAAMQDALAHRGPDDTGMYVDGSIGVASTRLSIIDLPGGHQPMSNRQQSIWVVFNGEIYNHVELRETYLESRFDFATNSDTEVLLHLYELFGESCVKHLNGMFAFAIWDRDKQTLFLARDRIGEKPLYYAEQHGFLVFASEIKSLLRHPKISFDVRPTDIDEFITYGFVQTPSTLFSGIRKLAEGHTLTWKNGKSVLRGYWDLDFRPNFRVSEGEHAERVYELLNDSVRLRLRSDVPTGLLLSGGLDSSSIATLVGKPLKTFSVDFNVGSDDSELHYARLVAKHLGTEHHELVLSPAAIRDSFAGFVRHMEEPVTEAPGIALYLLSKFAAQEVKVALSGEGGDELFAGYPIYWYMTLIEQYRRVPHWIRRRVVDPLLIATWPSAKIEKYIHLSTLPLEERYLNVNLYDMRLKNELYHPDFRQALGPFDALGVAKEIYRKTTSSDTLSRMLYLDTKTWLPNDILIKADRMSMAASLELRSPFLDYRLIEYAANIPSRYKLRYGHTKYILRRAMRNVLPKEILRRGKMGFVTPIASILKRELRAYAEDVLLDKQSESRRYFDPRFVRRVLREHAEGKADHHSIIWRLLILEEWHRQFSDSRSAGLAA